MNRIVASPSSNPSASHHPPLSSNRSSMARIFRQSVTASDRNTINQYLIDAEKDLRGFEVEINRHKAAILTLEARRSKLQKKMQKYRSLLSPIHRMPTEVLANIFKACEEDYYIYDVPPMLMTITEVCGRWRDVTVSIPSLWSGLIAVRFNWWKYQSPDRLERLGQIIHLFLKRSQMHPLTLTLDFGCISEATFVSKFLPIVDHIFTTSHRWKRVRLGLNSALCLHPRFQSLRGGLPILETLELDMARFGDEDFGEMDIFANCPSLHSFTLQLGCNFDSLVEKIVLPKSQIRSLSFHCSDGEEVLPILSSFPCVDRLEFDAITSTWPDAPTNQQTINSIRRLVISAETQDQGSLVLNSMSLPLLSSLYFEGPHLLDFREREDSPYRWLVFDEKPFAEFLQRSSCPLTSLTLKQLPITDEQTITLLRLMPALTHLHLEEHTGILICNPPLRNKIVTSSFFRQLTADDEGSPEMPASSFLPRLTELELVVMSRDFDGQALLDAVASRMQRESEEGLASLQALSLTVFSEVPDETLPECFESLRCLKDAGLRLELSPEDWDEDED